MESIQISEDTTKENYKEEESKDGRKDQKFTEEWKEWGIEKEEAEKWINIGLTVNDADFAEWLRNHEKEKVEEYLDVNQEGRLKELRKKYDSLSNSPSSFFNREHFCYRLKCVRGGIRQVRKEKFRELEPKIICGVPVSKLNLSKPVSCLKWINRGVSMVGGSLILVGASDDNKLYSQMGGIVAITSPVIESLLSGLQDELESEEAEGSKLAESLKYFEGECAELRGIVRRIEKNDFFTTKEKEKFKGLSESLEAYKKSGFVNVKIEDIEKKTWKEFRKFKEIKEVEEKIWVLVSCMEEEIKSDFKAQIQVSSKQ